MRRQQQERFVLHPAAAMPPVSTFLESKRTERVGDMLIIWGTYLVNQIRRIIHRRRSWRSRLVAPASLASSCSADLPVEPFDGCMQQLAVRREGDGLGCTVVFRVPA